MSSSSKDSGREETGKAGRERETMKSNSYVEIEEIAPVVDEKTVMNDDAIKIVVSSSKGDKNQEFLDKAFKQNKLDPSHFKLTGQKDTAICCIPCKTEIALGKSYKLLSNVYAHAKHDGHKTAVVALVERLSRKRRSEANSVNGDAEASTAFSVKVTEELLFEERSGRSRSSNNFPNRLEEKLKVRNAHGEIFKLHEGTIVCTCCSTRFTPFPPHGNVIRNVETQVKTKDHEIKAAQGKKQTNMSYFFTKKRKANED